VAATIANVHRGRDREPFTPREFMATWDPAEVERLERERADDAAARFMAALGGGSCARESRESGASDAPPTAAPGAANARKGEAPE
jgi:hypothetical protein